MLTVFPVPAFADNYLWIIHDAKHAVAIDPGDATPVIDYLTLHGLNLSAILITHHHGDHVGGIRGLLDWCGEPVPVYGPPNENIPHLSQIAVSDTIVSIRALELEFDVIEVPGHTAGHVAYYAKKNDWLFCGDTLFAGGCGRLFEGSAAQMQSSLAKLRALPSETAFFCAHEYTLANLRFALAVEPNNTALKQRVVIETEKRSRGVPTLPSTIGLERATNPFFRWDAPDVIVAAGNASSGKISAVASPASIFGAIREWKNNF
ncbi:MAG: hydroxyacylglutathione hydrolase [Pseudomonadota bacterium]